MSNEFFKNLLKYHQNLVDPDFLRSILKKINQRNKKRINIMLIFTLLGTLTCASTLLILKPTFSFANPSYDLTTIGATCVSIFFIWLIFEETQASS